MDGKWMIGAFNQHDRLILGVVCHPKVGYKWAREENKKADLTRMRKAFEETYPKESWEQLSQPAVKETE
jgi:hypothetical protein